jgi:hypothetical protein
MRAKNIPLEERKILPIFLSKGKIVWIFGLPVSEEFKINPSTTTALLIEKIN